MKKAELQLWTFRKWSQTKKVPQGGRWGSPQNYLTIIHIGIKKLFKLIICTEKKSVGNNIFKIIIIGHLQKNFYIFFDNMWFDKSNTRIESLWSNMFMNSCQGKNVEMKQKRTTKSQN